VKRLRNYLCKWLNEYRETKEPVLEFTDRNYAIEKLKRQQKVNEELARQIKEKEKAILRKKEKTIETRKKIDDNLQQFKEKYEMELKQKRLKEIKDGQLEMQRSLKQHELRKSQELSLKERERQELINSYNEFKHESDINESKRVSQLKELTNYLKKQIQHRIQEDEKEKEWEKEQYNKMKQNETIAANACPHGKRYICAKCKRTCPRAYLSKRPLHN